MKKLLFAAALFLASFAADAQSLTYELGTPGFSYQETFPQLNETKDSLVFQCQNVVVKIAGAPEGKHEQVYSTVRVALELPYDLSKTDSLLRLEVVKFVNKTYDQVKDGN
jgi:hypothetical protein